jgi:pyruvate dehydrogenase E2 component (dihydrolipoamide acetyltransferase)
MGYLIRMPQMGMEMEEGEVVAWEVDEGDAVEEDEVVAVVESEKVTNEVEARGDGTVRRIVVPEGGTVEPGTPIGIFAGPDEDVSGLEAEIEQVAGGPSTPGPDASSGGPTDSSPDEATGGSSGGASGTSSDAPATAPSGGPEPSSDDRAGAAEDVRATPGAREAARDQGVDLTAVEGTGPQGVVTEGDVEDHAVETGGTDDGANRTVRDVRELSGVQETIGDRLSESYRNAVHVTVNRSFDAGTLLAVETAAASADVDVSLSDLLVAAVGAQLEAQPAFNALYQDGEHRIVDEVNVGVAVDLEEGLVTPVVPSVTDKTVEEIAIARAERVERVTAGEFAMDDLAGGTFTVSNLGPLGVDHFDPIINPPEVAILGVGRVREDESMTLSLSFDHRVVNGADAARFLDGLVDRLTDATALVGRFDADVAVDDG